MTQLELDTAAQSVRTALGLLYDGRYSAAATVLQVVVLPLLGDNDTPRSDEQ